MSVTQVTTPTSIDTYPALFAQELLETEPRTRDHLYALDAYLLATMAVAQQAAPGRYNAEDLNFDYLRTFTQTAQEVGAAVLIPSIGWDNHEWNRWARIGQASLVIPQGFDARTWSNVFLGIVTGEVAIQDRRRYDRISAFVRIGEIDYPTGGA
ncbi:MAG TPA: hypothetical protein VGO07_02675 [Candidatus Saccharimonadales bacterium]|jgi:hypothetical protein|nr:hypothetical protein [Candidatus Saccharimonadales bacterium]